MNNRDQNDRSGEHSPHDPNRPPAETAGLPAPPPVPPPIQTADPRRAMMHPYAYGYGAIVETAPKPPKKDVNLQLVLGALGRWWMVALPIGLLLAAVAGAAVYMTFEPKYEASAWLRIKENRPYVAFSTNEDSKRFIETQVETIRSPIVLEKVLSNLEIRNLPVVAKNTQTTSPVDWLKKKIAIKQIGKSEYYSVSFQASDRGDAADIVNAVVEEYFAFMKNEELSQTQHVIQLLKDEKERRKGQLEGLLTELQDLAKTLNAKPNLSINSDDTHLIPEDQSPKAMLENKVLAMEIDMAVLESEIAAFEEMVANKKVEVSAAVVETVLNQDGDLQQMMNLIETKRTKLLEILKLSAKGKEDPFYKNLEAEIDGAEEDLADHRDRIRDLVRANLEEQAKHAQTGTLDQMRSTFERQGILKRTLTAKLDRETKEAQQEISDRLVYEFKRGQLQHEALVYHLIEERAVKLYTEQMAPARVTLQKDATPPALPIETKPFKIMGLAMALCFCVPFGLAVVWEKFHQRVDSSSMVESHTNVNVIGEIVRLPARTRGIAQSGSRANQGLLMFEESVDGLRTNLFLANEYQDVRVIAVVSSAENEGKTSVAAQLAVSISRATHHPTLLIDGDMRRPDIHNVFGIRQEPGLAEVLSGEIELEDAIVTDWGEHLHFLPAGRLQNSPHALMGNGNVKSLLDSIPSEYRHVIIDTPPILAASESLVLAKAADATLFCVMQDTSRIDQVIKAHQRLVNSGAKTAGTVVNGVAARTYASKYGHYGYGYGYPVKT